MTQKQTKLLKQAPGLPDTLSGLLRLAVKDAQKVAKSKRYRLKMWTWHEPETLKNGKKVCSVCMAGAVIAKSLKASVKDSVSPWGLRETEKLIAIDDMRTGCLLSAGGRLGLDIPHSLREEFKDIVGYNTFSQRSSRAPWRAYLKAAALLEENGL